MEWSTACLDWERRLIDRESIIPPPIFPDQAEAALAIFRQLRVVDLPGKPTFGECSEQWVFDFVAAIFGAYEGETGKQLIREYFLLISKKNTKSTIAAGIMLTALVMCWREEEEHLILAPTKEVADNSFKPAAAMVRADDELLAMFHIQDHIRTITHRVTRSSLKVVAADTDTVSGKKAGRVLVDEHWLFGKRANAEAMFMEALGGQVSREEGWVIYLSTQSDEPPAGVFKEKLGYYRDVRDGKIEDRKSLGILYEYPAAMIASKAYENPANFYVTNPNVGRSVSSEWLEDQLKKNRAKLDGAFQQFLAKHLNVEIGLGLRAGRWAGADFWMQQALPCLTLEELIARSELATIGIDGGGLEDLFGLCVLGRETETGRWLAWTKAWAHPSVLERRQSEASKFRDFEKDGDMVIVSRVRDDIEQVADIVAMVNESGLLDREEGKKACIGVDPSGLGDTLDALMEVGIQEDQIVSISQGWRLMTAIQTTERRLAGGELWHGGQPLMAYCVGNAKTTPKGNAVMIEKAVSGRGKIDPLMALFNAVELMSRNPQANTGSVYDDIARQRELAAQPA
ncbi:MAG: terminase large subunit [Roseateles sp.]|uniref:terminase large subunit n=1 Tax=Roseateles sp. TaxID=1971397 RepID=UPI0040374951